MKNKAHTDVTLEDLLGAGMTPDKMKTFAEGARFLFGAPEDREQTKPSKPKGVLAGISSPKAGKHKDSQKSPILAPKRKVS